MHDQYWIFVYTSHLLAKSGAGRDCHILVEELKRSLGSRLQFRFASYEEVLEEVGFLQLVGSSSMRQWFKLSKAYEMMIEHEEREQQRFDLVLKLRTDTHLNGPLQLEDFPDVWSRRVVYSWYDIAFFCRRDVAEDILGQLLRTLLSRSGQQKVLLPFNYERLLRVGLGNGLKNQIFPDIDSAAFREAVQGNKAKLFEEEVRRHRKTLEAAHQRAEAGHQVPIVTGHERFRPETDEYKELAAKGKLVPENHMCPVTHWFYHLHSVEPEVMIRNWPWDEDRPLRLDPMRFTKQCNCEPPDCVPEQWSQVAR
eukprot:TRINITY_DN29822_c0_g1_i2.p1 TRINITY_DN29822_c0_g1~~TRINITY_DN29822_c0_g1_i2.p1  ORF type:complete len:310 (-),score=64.77 TRINITY_DN29822_c0_g1_i2:10-939(-)